jgi:N-acyl-D-amino-acid deacylase
VVDGTGAPARAADVAVSDGCISAVGRIETAEGDQVLDVAGLTVAPGFHDVHTHYDLALLAEPGHLDGLRQGITTYHIGQCGLGFAPASPKTQAVFREYMAAISGNYDLPLWNSVDDYLDLFDQVAAVNSVYLIPHGLLRVEVAGMREGPVTAAETERMQALVAQGMEQGARGVSSGLGYFPGTEADLDELTAVCQAAADLGGAYVSHIRDYAGGLLDAIDEACEVGRRAGLPTHISHLRPYGPYRGRAREVLERVDAARARGIDAGFDSYTYLKGCTLMSSLVVPPCLYAGGIDFAVEVLQDELARKVIRGVVPEEPWREIHISSVGSERNKRFEGLRLDQFAATVGKDPFTACVDLLIEERFQVAVVGWPIEESDLRTILRHPLCLIGSDGIPAGSARHPRAAGTFARYLGRYVRDLGLLSLEEAIHRITALAARRFGITDRGEIAPEQAADITVFDPETIIDRATYDQPRRLAEGVKHVLVNGQLVLRDGELTDARPGIALRP